MSRKLPYTPNSQIRSAMRRMFLRSRERASRIKSDKYTCQICGAKQSRANGREVKVEVHHTEGVLNWPDLIAAVRAYLLCDPSKLQTLCEECHNAAEDSDNASKVQRSG